MYLTALTISCKMATVLELISKYVAYPLSDWRESAVRLRELRELEKSQYLELKDLRVLQSAKLRRLLKHAMGTCDFYREKYADLAVDAANISIEELSRLPLLTKAEVRNRSSDMLSSAIPRDALFESRTGGSTGKALVLHFDKRCQEMRNAASMRADRWSGWDLGEMTAAVWGNPPYPETWRARFRNLLLERTMYLDTMQMSPESVQAFAEEWRARRPAIIFGHSHSVYILAKFIDDLQILGVRPRAVISTSMMLLPNERAVIERVFSCRVFNKYGCEEVGLIASECEVHDGMHVNEEHVIVECVDDEGRPVDNGVPGNIVVTDLSNFGMPMIRYRIEDVAVMSAGACSCGRGSRRIQALVGRVADFLVRQDASLVAGVSLVERTLTSIPGLDQMQIVQNQLDEIQISVVPGAAYNEASRRALEDEFRQVFGESVRLEIRKVEAIPQEGNGKYRFSICKVPALKPSATA